MIVGRVPVTFSFTVNWTGPDDGVPSVFQSFGSALSETLQAAAAAAV
jgi:hypothetical protein